MKVELELCSFNSSRALFICLDALVYATLN